MAVLILIAALIVVAICIRVVAGEMDGDRVGHYVRSQGGELIESHWSPFGRGWVGEKNDRIYEVRYRDKLGNIHEATVKTSMLSGVYFTQDKIIQPSVPSQLTSYDVEEENARLRQRIAELEDKNQSS